MLQLGQHDQHRAAGMLEAGDPSDNLSVQYMLTIPEHCIYGGVVLPGEPRQTTTWNGPESTQQQLYFINSFDNTNVSEEAWKCQNKVTEAWWDFILVVCQQDNERMCEEPVFEGDLSMLTEGGGIHQLLMVQNMS